MNVIERFRSLPQSSRRLLSVGIIVALIVALPLFIWAIINLNFNPNKKAASGEPTSTPTPTPLGTPNTNPPVCGQSSITPNSGNAPLTVTLFGAGEAGSGTGFDGYEWDFDNNGTWDTAISIDPPATHTYTLPGTYHPVYRIHGTNNVWSVTCNYPYSIVVGNGTATPPPTVRPFSILLKLDGVSDGSANLAKVTVRFVSSSLNNLLGYITPPLPIVYVGNGVYRLPFGIWSTELPSASDYALIIKGEKHLATRFCISSGQTQHCSGNDTRHITIPQTPSTMVSLDFTGIPLEPGDLYPQDGVVDSNDFNKIRTLLSKPCADLTDQDKLIGDVDYNGCVNAKDAFLVRKTLETRYDEN